MNLPRPTRNLYFTLSVVSIYFTLIWVFHMLFVSVVAYFHFQLNHSMAIIQDWVHYYGWEIISLSKVLALFIITVFLNIREEHRLPYFYIYKKYSARPDYFIGVALTFFFLSFIIIGRPSFAQNIDFVWLRALISFFGILLYYMCDVFLLIYICHFFLNKKNHKILLAIGFSVITYSFSSLSFAYGTNFTSVFLLSSVLFNIIAMYKNGSWSIPLIFIFFLWAPILSLSGLDPIYGREYEFFGLKHLDGNSIYFNAIIISVTVYIIYNWSDKKITQ